MLIHKEVEKRMLKDFVKWRNLYALLVVAGKLNEKQRKIYGRGSKSLTMPWLTGSVSFDLELPDSTNLSCKMSRFYNKERKILEDIRNGDIDLAIKYLAELIADYKKLEKEMK